MASDEIGCLGVGALYCTRTCARQTPILKVVVYPGPTAGAGRRKERRQTTWIAVVSVAERNDVPASHFFVVLFLLDSVVASLRAKGAAEYLTC